MTVAELNSIIGVCYSVYFYKNNIFTFKQQMHAQGAAFPHGHSQAPHLAALSAAHGASPFGLPGGGGLPPGLLALQGVAAAAQQAFLKDEKGLEMLYPFFVFLNMFILLDNLERAEKAAAAAVAAATAAAASSHKVCD